MKHPILCALALLVAFSAGAGVGSVKCLLWSYEPVLPPPQMDDIRAVMRALKPLARGGYNTDVRIFMWADESVNITVKMPGGSDLASKGSSLSDAVYNLADQNLAVSKALLPLLAAGRGQPQ